MEFFDVIRKRASYRAAFQEDPVPREDLEKIVDAGIRAPSGKNAASPNTRRISPSASPPSAVSSREIASASTWAAPSDFRYCAASDFPHPMPPVSPIT